MEGSGAVSVAMVVPTPELLRQMLAQRPACWTWAAFASALFQRWGGLEERKIAQVLGADVRPTATLDSSAEVAEFVAGQMRGADDIVAQVNVFLASPGFASVFGSSGDEGTADADGILAAADHLAGDCYQRLLELAERIRGTAVPAEHAALLADCARFSNQHLQDFGWFVNDVLHRLEEMQNRVMLGQKPFPVELRLRTTTDDQLIWSILDRLQTMG